MRIILEYPEPIDALCRRIYGSESGHVEALLDINPGLAALAPILPAGTVLTGPAPSDAEPSETVPVVSLWD